MRKLLLFGLILLLSGSSLSASTQESAPPTTARSETSGEEVHHFQLKFRVLELEEGKVINSRNYTMEITTRNKDISSMRTNERIPIATGSVAMPDYQYVDNGIKFDCSEATLVGNSLNVNIISDIDSLDAAPTQQPNRRPIVSNRRMSSRVLLALGKPTIIFSSDGLSSKRVMQLEVTATKLP